MAIKISFLFLTVFFVGAVLARPDGGKVEESDASKVINEMMQNVGDAFEKLKNEGLPNLDKLLSDVTAQAQKLGAQLGDKGKEIVEQIQAKAKEQGLVKE